MRSGRGGKAGIAAASALLAFTLVAPPLLSSSATSAALQTSLGNVCPADAGLVLNVERAWLPELAAAASDIDHTQTPIVSELALTRIRTVDGSDRAIVLARDGATEHLPGGPVAEPAGSVLVPGSYAATSDVGPGDELTFVGGARDVEVEVGSTYPDVPVRPEPAAWCGIRELLRPSGAGASASPVLLTDEATVAATGTPSTLWELDPDTSQLTEQRAETLQRELVALATSVDGRRGTAPDIASTLVPDRVAPELASIIESSRQHGDAVTGSMIGPRLIAFAIAMALLVAAIWLLVRQGRDELTIRAIRGEGPAGLGVRVAERAALPVLLGVVVGTAAGFLAVRGLGPSDDIDTSATRRALVLAAVALVLAIVTVGVTGGRRADALVDRTPTRRVAMWPWEVVPVVVALVGLIRLDRVGGLQIAGAPPVATDALAQAFPAFALAAIGAVLMRPTRWLYTRARHGGRGLGPAGLLGWRRLSADAGANALLTGAAILAVGASLIGGSVVRTVDRAVEAKATTFLGSDLRVVTADEPVIPTTIAATPVSRASARSGDTDVVILGIDPDTFASSVYWDDASSNYPLTELLHVLQVDDMEGAPLPAVLVGGRLTAPVFTTDGEPVGVDLNIIATADSFPGKTAEPLIIVNRDALAADEVPTAQELWLRDPPPDAVDRLAAAGNTVRGSQTVDGVFDPAGTAATRWSAGTLLPFAVLVVVGVLVAAGLLLGWRRPARSAGWAIRPPIGEPRREESLATVIAMGIPVLIGIVVGGVSGWIVARLVVDRLDTIDTMAPRASLAVDLVPPGVVALGLVAVVVLSAISASSGLARADPLEVTRDGIGR